MVFWLIVYVRFCQGDCSFQFFCNFRNLPQFPQFFSPQFPTVSWLTAFLFYFIENHIKFKTAILRRGLKSQHMVHSHSKFTIWSLNIQKLFFFFTKVCENWPQICKNYFFCRVWLCLEFYYWCLLPQGLMTGLSYMSRCAPPFGGSPALAGGQSLLCPDCQENRFFCPDGNFSLPKLPAFFGSVWP